MIKGQYVYILECSDSTYYTGYTTNVLNRVKIHNLGKYTRARRPCKLVYYVECTDKSSALKLEYKIKQMSRKEKADLIRGVLKEK